MRGDVRRARPHGARPDERAANFEAELIDGLEPFAARELARMGALLGPPWDKSVVSSSVALTPTLSQAEREPELPLRLGEGWGEGEPATRRSSLKESTPARRQLRSRHGVTPGEGAETLRFRYADPWPRLLESRTVVAVHAVVASGLPRPSVLLDDGVFKRLVAAVGHIRALHPRGAFASFRLSAAGADSPQLQRVRERLARETGLRDVPEGGDLLLRFKRQPVFGITGGAGVPARPARAAGRDARPTEGFELTARLSPRPLSARPWRVCNLPGALNATVATAMARLTAPAPEDVYLNLACGSGTLLVERAALGPARRLVGCDTDAHALACAADNLRAAGLPDVELHAWNACAVPLPDGSVSALVADLPFGQLMGSHGTNERLYPALLAEAARLARPGARFVAITQQVNLFERCLRAMTDAWSLEHTIRLDLPANRGVLKPRVYALRRPR